LCYKLIHLLLTPKGPTCIFWQHRNFGQVRVIRDLYISGWNFNRRWGQGTSFIYTNTLNFMTFENMSQKLWPNMLVFSLTGQFGQIWKNHFFQKQKIEIGFLKLFLRGKLLIIPFWSMSQKLWGVLICGQLWILYSKISFEVLYSIQFSMFFKINKIHRM